MRFCERCGAMNEDDSRFCTSCGQPVSADDPGSGPAPIASNAPQAPGGYRPSAAPARQASQGQHAAPAQAAAPAAQGQHAQASPALADELADLTAAQAEVAKRLQGADDRMAAVDARLGDIEQVIVKLADLFDEKISRNEHEASALKQVSAEVEEYRNGLYEKLTMPFIRDIIEVRTGLEAALKRHAGAEAVPASEVAMFSQMLADTLTKHSVEIASSQPGDEFLSFKHQVVGQVPTSDASLHGRVAEVSGESYRMGDQYIAPALVKIYTLDESAPEAGN